MSLCRARESGAEAMKLETLFQQKACVFSLEVFPPRKHGGDIAGLLPVLEKMKALHPDFVSVTYGAGGGPAGMSTVRIASHLKHVLGVEPLAHLTCVNSSEDEIDRVLDALNSEQVKNILALRGDRVPQASPKDAYAHADQLVRKIKACGDFYVAGACYPEGHAESPSLTQDIEFLKRKVDAGVQHLVTQLFFDNARFFRFMNLMRKKGIRVPVQAGVMPIVSKRQIERTVALSSASLPPQFTKMISRYAEDEQAMFDAGIAYAVEQLRDLIEGGVDGVHLYAMNNPEVARRVYEGIADLLPEASE